MPNRSHAFRMANNLTGGRLEEIVRGQLAEERSHEQVSRQIFADFGVEVSGSTLRRWFPTETTESVA